MVKDLSKEEKQQKEIDELKQQLHKYQVKLKMREKNKGLKQQEQYTTKFSLEEHQVLQKAVKWLHENGFLKETSKYKVTKYALNTLVEIVESKKKKAELVKQEVEQDIKHDVKDGAEQNTKQDVKQDIEQKEVS